MYFYVHTQMLSLFSIYNIAVGSQTCSSYLLCTTWLQAVPCFHPVFYVQHGCRQSHVFILSSMYTMGVDSPMFSSCLLCTTQQWAVNMFILSSMYNMVVGSPMFSSCLLCTTWLQAVPFFILTHMYTMQTVQCFHPDFYVHHVDSPMFSSCFLCTLCRQSNVFILSSMYTMQTVQCFHPDFYVTLQTVQCFHPDLYVHHVDSPMFSSCFLCTPCRQSNVFILTYMYTMQTVQCFHPDFYVHHDCRQYNAFILSAMYQYMNHSCSQSQVFFVLTIYNMTYAGFNMFLVLRLHEEIITRKEWRWIISGLMPATYLTIPLLTFDQLWIPPPLRVNSMYM